MLQAVRRARMRAAARGPAAGRRRARASPARRSLSAIATSICGMRSRIASAVSSSRQRRDQRADAAGQHFAALQVGDVAGAALAEAHQAAALLRHVARAEARAATVVPAPALQRRQPCARASPCRCASRFSRSSRCLTRELRSGVEVLQRAAAADAEMRATRRRRARATARALARSSAFVVAARRACGAGPARPARPAARRRRTRSCPAAHHALGLS